MPIEVKRVPGHDKNTLEVLIHSVQGKVGKVGWLDGSQYPNGISVAKVAAVQELGYPPKNIPPRPFLRPTFTAQKQKWTELFQKGAKAILAGNETAHSVMEKVTSKAAGDVRKTIELLTQPALAEGTVLARIRRHSSLNKKKGRLTEPQIGNVTKPLIDTSLMLGSLTSAVEDE